MEEQGYQRTSPKFCLNKTDLAVQFWTGNTHTLELELDPAVAAKTASGAAKPASGAAGAAPPDANAANAADALSSLFVRGPCSGPRVSLMQDCCCRLVL
jgi:hypothetical protein